MRPAAIATYRLQLHGGFDLRAARAVIPYLARLGISHVYVSPLLQARHDSRHGYDVVDPTRLDPKLGTPADLTAFVRTLRRHGMGLVLDIVPNHMAIGAENRFWEDVLTHGAASRYARWFDVAWRSASGRRAPLRIPVLGDVRARALSRGELGLVLEGDRVRLRYFAARFPLDPATLVPLLERVAARLGTSRATHEIERIAARLSALPSRDGSPGPGRDRAAAADAALDRLARLFRRDVRVRAMLERVVAGTRGRILDDLLEQQVYRVVHWRRGAGDVNYRRFFAVSELVGLRVEDPAVFAATHARLRDWVARELVDIVRVDHVDGLADPLGYLQALRALLDDAGASEVAILIEKILTGHEQVRAEWPVAGTTGYEFLAVLDAAFVDARGFAAIGAWYHRACGAHGFRAVAWAGKREMADSWLAPDVRRLAELLPIPGRTRDRRAHREAITELLVGLPLYRTYVDARRGSPARADRAVLMQALAAARRRGRASGPALRTVVDALLRPRSHLPFVQRFQQVSGALMAKGIEDTALYRWMPLASRNEVGTDPSAPLRGTVARLHASHTIRARRFPAALSATTTHDSKRSADARARLNVLAEIPNRWTGLVARWHARHHRWRRRVDGRRVPDATTEYLVYQTAVALRGDAAAVDRVRSYIVKASREAAVHTSWLAPAPAWEDAVDRFIVDVFASAAFRRELAALAETITRPALWTALARTLIHLTAPGVPDIYQGDELWRFLLVDPDNRGDVDFARRAAMLASSTAVGTLVAQPEDGRIKLHTIRAALALRRHAVDVFRGGYVPLDRGEGRLRHVIAFARTAGRRAAITIVPRLVLSLLHGRSDPPVGRDVWGDTALELPSSLAGRRWRNVLTGETFEGNGRMVRVADALGEFPVALAWSEG